MCSILMKMRQKLVQTPHICVTNEQLKSVNLQLLIVQQQPPHPTNEPYTNKVEHELARNELEIS